MSVFFQLNFEKGWFYLTINQKKHFKRPNFLSLLNVWFAHIGKQDWQSEAFIMLFRFVVRDFTYNEEQLAAGKNELSKLINDKKKNFVSS